MKQPEPAASKPPILIVDDTADDLKTLEFILTHQGYSCVPVTDPRQAVAMARQHQPFLVISDLHMPEMSGLDLLKEFQQQCPGLMVMIVTGDGSLETAVTAMHMGALDYLRKPLAPKEVGIRVERALERHRLATEVHDLRGKLDSRKRTTTIVGQSQVIRHMLDSINLLAASDASVLIHGESGTGKELVAREVHEKSERMGKPFVAVDCVSLPDPLITSELFGHEKGAFTGATEDRIGLLEMAKGGTVFFDEITELGMDVQAKLLRVLQERQFRRVGGRKLIDLDVRILSATNRDPRKAVNENLLREDLYYRLNVIPVQVPPLRERRDDIPLLVDHFLHVLAERHHRPMKQVAPAAMELLQRHTWPGNVRELQNSVHRLFVMTTADTIDADAVRGTIEPETTAKEDNAALFGMPLKDAKLKLAKQFERQYIQQLLTAHQYAIGRAAEAAGVNRKTLARLAEEHGLLAKG
ncbi:MAG: hypothetical protein A3K19_00340 [Lentisphaerae bacterium RIFOXYB12_FULL_65_16]|nr:MAG: hypothetical protein A3K18_00390 [Lentisphaerae bacterium RIFOXYA12_64_32]OGV85370.1 MAG: hypothetical protein A3K19_00340 [Lentisphaerae bacterium RIFOXYB12_FULL_65_16]